MCKKISITSMALYLQVVSYKKTNMFHGLQHDVTIAPYSLVLTTLHEFHDSKGHQGTIHTFEAIRRSYSWPKI